MKPWGICCWWFTAFSHLEKYQLQQHLRNPLAGYYYCKSVVNKNEVIQYNSQIMCVGNSVLTPKFDRIELMKGKALRKHSLHGKTAASDLESVQHFTWFVRCFSVSGFTGTFSCWFCWLRIWSSCQWPSPFSTTISPHSGLCLTVSAILFSSLTF